MSFDFDSPTMPLPQTRSMPTLLAALCQSVALAVSPMLGAPLLGANHALDSDDGGLNSQRQFSPPQMQRYVSELVRRYDVDGDGLLQTSEWQHMRGQPQRIDYDGDLRLTYQEILRHVSQYAIDRRIAPPRNRNAARPSAAPAPHPEDLASSSPAARTAAKPFFVPDRFLPPGLPDWFRARDTNGDAQLSLAEFAPTGEAQLAAQFQRSDTNRDGLITPAEAVRAAGKIAPVTSTERTPPEQSAAKASGAP